MRVYIIDTWLNPTSHNEKQHHYYTSMSVPRTLMHHTNAYIRHVLSISEN